MSHRVYISRKVVEIMLSEVEDRESRFAAVEENEVFQRPSTMLDPQTARLAGQKYALVSFVAPKGWECTAQHGPCLAFKVRGVFSSVEAALAHRDFLEEHKVVDADIFVCPLYTWAPLPPDRNKMSMRNTIRSE